MKIPIGLKIGKLIVLQEGNRRILPSGQKPKTVDCLCECGNIKNILWLHFIRERTFSCGCSSRIKNGVSKTKLYRVYRGMLDRCDGKVKKSLIYHYKSITVCDEWKNNHTSFIKWSLDNGYKEGLQIDRIDNSKGYSPVNCRWVTPQVNMNNKENTFRVIYKNKTYAFTDLCRKLKKDDHHNTIRRRIKRGWTVQNAFDTPLREGNYHKKNNN